MAFSEIGRKKVSAQSFFLLLDIIVLGLSAKVAKFNDFFYVADLFPLSISIITLIFVSIMLGLDFALDASWTGYAQVEIGVFGILSVFWLAFNAFSTSRWRNIPLNCNSIPAQFPEERIWCRNVQALKVFIWITFVACLFITLWTARICISQYKRGQKHIFSVPLSRFSPKLPETTAYNEPMGREFMQYEKTW